MPEPSEPRRLKPPQDETRYDRHFYGKYHTSENLLVGVVRVDHVECIYLANGRGLECTTGYHLETDAGQRVHSDCPSAEHPHKALWVMDTTIPIALIWEGP